MLVRCEEINISGSFYRNKCNHYKMCVSAMYIHVHIYASEVWFCDVGLVCRLNMCPPSSQKRYVLHSLYNPMYFHCMNIAQVQYGFQLKTQNISLPFVSSSETILFVCIQRM